MLKKFAKSVARRAYGVPLVADLVPEAAWVKSGVLDPFVVLARSMGVGRANAGAGGPVVLFLRMRFVPRLSTTELVLAKQLADDGASPVFAYCSPVLKCCNGWDIRSADPKAECEKCHRGNRRIAAMLAWPSSFLADDLLESDYRDAEAFSSSIAIADLKNLVIEGQSLANEMYRSLAKYLFIGTIAETPENTEFARGFAQAAFLLVRGLNRLFDRVDPDVVVMNCGHVMWYGIAYRLLASRGVRSVTFDETNIAVTHLSWNFDDAHPCVDYVWDEDWKSARNVSLAATERGAIESLLDDRRRRFLYEPTDVYETVAELEDLSRFERVYTLFTNVPWDATIVGKDIVFESMQDWVDEATRIASRHPDTALVIRIHPAEAGVYGMISRERVATRLLERLGELPANVFLVDAERRVNSYRLIEQSDGVLIYCSNVGLEAVLMGKPAVVAGAAHFRNKGITLDIDTPEAFAEVFEQWCIAAPEAPDTELALRYAHLAFIETQIDLALFDDPHPHAAHNLRVSDFGEPLPGATREVFGALSKWIRSADFARGPFTNSIRERLGED